MKIAAMASSHFTNCLVVVALFASFLFGTTEKVIGQSPSISSISPAAGPVGTLVTVTGTNLSTPTNFTIAGVACVVVSNNGNSLVGMVMPGAVSGSVAITTAGGSVSSSTNFTVTTTPTPSAQQGNRLIGNSAVGNAQQGFSVAVSADGSTAIIGGPGDNGGAGAAWIFTRSGGVWSQQGSKLVGAGAKGAAQQGYAVALSADGNTAIVGGFVDDAGIGAAWIYTRSGGLWNQQGNKLVGTGAVDVSLQGFSVSLSADGNTAMVGGRADNVQTGAAWMYTRSGDVWSQQGNKLVGAGAQGPAAQGGAVALSADGNTAIMGGYDDNDRAGAVWIFTRSGGNWNQQGNKLVGTGAVGLAAQGGSVSLSADGNTAIFGGFDDNSAAGAAWVFTRSGGVWSQQGGKLVGAGASGNARQGWSVSLAADGNTAIVGGPEDQFNNGAAWVYTRSGGAWIQQGNKIRGTGAEGRALQAGAVAISADGTTALVGGAADNTEAGATWAFGPGAAAPSITSFTPATGAIGTLVTITGTNLASATFTIGGIEAVIVSKTETKLVGMVMPGSSTGSIVVSIPGSTATSNSNFTVTPTPFPNAQQGGKLVGTGAIGNAQQGIDVALTADGNAAFVGGWLDDYNAGTTKSWGASWAFVRSGVAWSQQGNKIVGSDAISDAQEGVSVALSADGNTAVAGADAYRGTGAAKVFIRNGNVWTQQGPELIGTGAEGDASQGTSVAISADGNTVLVGGPDDKTIAGAAWVFTRSGDIWTQQGEKLVGAGSITTGRQGFSVALSADGNTAMIGAPGYSNVKGGAYVFTRLGGAWTQQGSFLQSVGTQFTGREGSSVSLSADGNTAILGAPSDDGAKGTAVVFARSGTSWAQQGNKLVGTGAMGAARQGQEVSLSADGNTAIVGGPGDDNSTGAAWVYTRNGGVWTQQGNKLVGAGAAGNSQQGTAVALSSNGSTALVGGPTDDGGKGATWVFTFAGVQSTDYFRSIASGSWNDPNTWESSPVADFSSGVVSPASVSPGASAKGISIRQNHSVTLTQNVSVRQLFVHPSGTLSIIGCTLTQLQN